MKLVLNLCLSLLVVSSSRAAVEVIAVTPTLPGVPLVIELQTPIDSITSCILHVVGRSQPKVISCDSPGGMDTFTEPYYMSARLEEDGVVKSDIFNNSNLSGSFDVSFEFASDDWSFLSDDGTADLVLFWARMEGGGHIGYCRTTSGGFLTYESVSLIITYKESVGVSSAAWGAIKSIYR